MEAQHAVDLGQQALWTALLLSAPALLVGLALALLIGVFQTVTQIQDPTLALVPKLVGVACAVIFCLPWIVDRLLSYSHELLTNVPPHDWRWMTRTRRMLESPMPSTPPSRSLSTVL